MSDEDATENDSRFDVTDARLLIWGVLEGSFGTLLQVELTRSNPLLDLIVDWTAPDRGFRAQAGYFRTPFSAELLIPAPRLDFIDRSQMVRALAPERQIGVQLDQEILGDRLVARAGVFNGNGRGGQDDDIFLYVLRLDGRIPCDDGWIFEYGVNGAYTDDNRANFGTTAAGPRQGEQLVLGGDVRVSHGPFFFSAEGLFGSDDGFGGPDESVWGYQGSLGYQLDRLIQVLGRYDSFHGGPYFTNQDLAIASLVVSPTDIISIQVELRVPTRGEDPTPGGVANLNVTF